MFITTHEKVVQFSAMQTQDIFRHRHIVVSQTQRPYSRFDRQGLMKLGSLTAERNILGVYPFLKVECGSLGSQSILKSLPHFRTEQAILAHSCTSFQDLMASPSGALQWLKYQWAAQMFKSLHYTGQIILPFHFLST